MKDGENCTECAGGTLRKGKYRGHSDFGKYFVKTWELVCDKCGFGTTTSERVDK